MADMGESLHQWLGQQIEEDPHLLGDVVAGLREIRQIHRPSSVGERVGFLASLDEPDERPMRYACDGCHASYQEETWTDDVEDCPILRALAWGYRHRDGWREEWTPRWGEG